MNRNRTIPILGNNGNGQEAYERFHAAMRNIARRQKIADKPISLGTHYSADETPESDSLPEWADEMDELRRDSRVGKGLVLLIAVCAALGAAAYLVG